MRVWTAVDWVAGRHWWGEALPKEGAAVSSSRQTAPAPRVRMRECGPVREDAHRLDPAKYVLFFTWKCSAAWCGSAMPEPLLELNPLGKPGLGSNECSWTLVSQRASSRKHIPGEVGVSIWEKTASSRISDSWGGKKPELATTRGSVAPLY